MRIDYPAPSHIPGLKALWKASFDDTDEELERFFRLCFSPERCRCVDVAGQAAAALYWFETRLGKQRFAYLYAVATHPDYRNRGLCRALMEDTLALLQKLGFSGAILKPETHALVRMYGAMGFVPGTGIREFSCRAEGPPLSIRAVNSEEYGKIRQQLLPEGGVIQDSGDLQLLAAQAQLYAGEDFLLAAAAEGERLRGIELLGNADAAPGILTVLGLKSGSFRTPGSDTPFTMLCPLAEGCAVPSYFGIVLD